MQTKISNHEISAKIGKAGRFCFIKLIYFLENVWLILIFLRGAKAPLRTSMLPHCALSLKSF